MKSDNSPTPSPLFDPDQEIKEEKLDFVVDEITIEDFVEENSDSVIQIQTKHDGLAENSPVIHEKLPSTLKGLLPEENNENSMKHSVLKTSCIEHSYFLGNVFTSNNLKLVEDTLEFANESLNKQQTVDLPLQEGNPVLVNNIVFKSKVNKKFRRRHCNSCSSSSSSTSSSSVEFFGGETDLNFRNESEGNSRNGENASVKVNRNCKIKRKPKWRNPRLKNDGRVRKKKYLSYRFGISLTEKPASRGFVSVSDLLTKMQKLLKAKCDKKYFRESEKAGKIPPPKLKKLTSRKGSDYNKMSNCLFKMPNISKVANGEKNWRLEYMDDEVQSLGLDDLLLKASELNAENFTKALGRKLDSVKSNHNTKDSSEIVFTIPKTKKKILNEDKSKNNADRSKAIKLDISKPFFESDATEKDKDGKEEASKPVDETSPKKPGIKVKTVENINEEFKDSLGVKNKLFDEYELNSKTKEITPSDTQNAYDSSALIEDIDKETRTNDIEKSEDRPFVMTILQDKPEKQRPAILRKSYLKKKVSSAEKRKSIEELSDTSIKSKTDANEIQKEIIESQVLKSDAENQNENIKCVSYPKGTDESLIDSISNKTAIKQRKIPFVINSSKKKLTEFPSIQGKVQSIVKSLRTKDGISDHLSQGEKTLKVTSVEQKLVPKEVNKRFIKVVPYEPANKVKKTEPVKVAENQQKTPEEELRPRDGKNLSLYAFSNLLKDILPEKWLICMDKKHGLQIIKTHVDEFLSPSVLISLVISRCGKLIVNVRGNRLKKTHELFNNISNMKNSENKLSLNYILAVLNKLRCLSVCFGCDTSLKKYWREDGVIESVTQFQEIYRSHHCQLLVTFGKKRCYACYRTNETLKNRYRKDKFEEKPKDENEVTSVLKEVPEEVVECLEKPKSKGVKRNLEDFLEESFSTMKQQIAVEIEKNKKLGEREKDLKTQEEVLSFMGLARKDSLDNSVRKSKRKKNSFYKFPEPVKKKINQQELEFLEKYWSDINTLFSTSLLFGAYSRTGRGRLREKCRMFHKLLSTWKNIVKSNPEWIGGEVNLPDESSDKESSKKDEESFEKMDVPALRAYIINSVKEVNRIKHKLRTKNSYFKILYNKFVKRRMKRPKSLVINENESSANSTTNTPTPTDLSSDESSRDKEKATDEDSCPVSELITTFPSDKD